MLNISSSLVSPYKTWICSFVRSFACPPVNSIVRPFVWLSIGSLFYVYPLLWIFNVNHRENFFYISHQLIFILIFLYLLFVVLFVIMNIDV